KQPSAHIWPYQRNSPCPSTNTREIRIGSQPSIQRYSERPTFVISDIVMPHFLRFVLTDRPTVGDNELATIFLVDLDEAADLLFSFLVGKPFFYLTVPPLQLGTGQLGCHSL